MFTDRKTQYCPYVSFSHFIYRFNAIPVRIPVSYFVNIDKLIVKFIWKDKRHRTVNTILKKKVGGPTLADLKPYYYRTTVIKAMWCWQKNRHIDQGPEERAQ